MNDHTPTETKEIPAERWVNWCDTFSNGNRGRTLSISFIDDVYGDEPLTDEVAFVAIDYDPVNKGNDFVVSFGERDAPTAHVVPAPVRLMQAQDANGLVVAVEIEDQNGRRTILSFG
jgi:hypothetical protein